jgi:cell division protein FtsQ
LSAPTLERPSLDGGGAGVDPRIAARRRSVESDRRRRRGRRLLVVVIVVFVVAGGWFLTRTGVLDVDSVQVQGAVHESDDDVLSASGLRIGDQLLDIDGGAAAAKLEELPWVDTAEVRTSLDGVLTITVSERVPVATVSDPAGGRHLVDASGRLLGPVEGDTAGLASLEGVVPGAPGETIEGAEGALQAMAALGPGVRSRVTAVVVAPDGALQLKLNPQGVVLLGPPTDLADKAAKLATVLGRVEQSDLAGISVVDPSNPVVWRTPR